MTAFDYWAGFFLVVLVLTAAAVMDTAERNREIRERAASKRRRPPRG